MPLDSLPVSSYPLSMQQTSVHFHKAVRLYQMIEQGAQMEEVDELPVRLFRGSSMDVYKSVRPGLSMADYGRLMRGLKYCGCITMLQKGARNVETIYALHHAPTEDQWATYERSPLTDEYGKRRLQETVLELRKEVETLRARQNQIAEHLGLELADDPAETSK